VVYTLKVVEIFKSLQGEGPMMGRPGAFLRLGGCNLRCPDCDTWYAWGGDEGSPIRPMEVPKVFMDLVDIFGGTASMRQGNVYVTGGEPLMQHEALGSLMLGSPETYWGIETNGTIYAPTFMSSSRKTAPSLIVPLLSPAKDSLAIGKAVVRSNVNFIVSPKLPSMHPEGLKFYDPAWSEACRGSGRVDFKFVVNGEEEIEMVEDFVKKQRIPRNRVWIMIKGVTGEEQMKFFKDAFTRVANEHWGFNLSARLHVLAYDNKRGV